MPSKKKKKKPFPLKRLIKPIALCLVGALAAAVFIMAVNASLVRLQTAEVYLSDLPEAFDGTKVLYLTDIHVDMFNPPNRVYGLIKQLMALEPDIVLLGGDFASFGLGEAVLSLGSEEAKTRVREQIRERLADLFASFRNFSPPLGIYAVTGASDHGYEPFEDAMAQGRIRLLSNELIRIEKGGETIVVAGIEEWTTGKQNIRSIAPKVRSDECVVLLSNNADVFPMLSAEPAGDGGRFHDLVLSGRTHGGQIVLFGRAAIENSIHQKRYMTGWFSENGAHLLVSNGVGASFVGLRYGAPPQAHLIYLKRKEIADLSSF